jgi:hypothetical protein
VGVVGVFHFGKEDADARSLGSCGTLAGACPALPVHGKDDHEDNRCLSDNKAYKYAQKEGIHTTLLSTGLTFGSIAALFGLSHQIIDKHQYSLLIVTVIASAVVPTLIANAFFIPKYLLPKKEEINE